MRQLLYFHASYCNRCKYVRKNYIKPIYDEVPELVSEIDAAKEPFVADRYKINKLPTIFLLEDGVPVKMSHGSIPIRKTIEWLRGDNDKSNNQ